jgi:c-di-GMP-related signal transduction protein
VKTALSGGENRLREVYEAVLVWERAEWPLLPAVAQRLGCDEEKVPEAYQLALQKASAVGV